jgi:hypothetical protein
MTRKPPSELPEGGFFVENNGLGKKRIEQRVTVHQKPGFSLWKPGCNNVEKPGFSRGTERLSAYF